MIGRALLYLAVAALGVLFVLQLRHGADLRPAVHEQAPEFNLPDLAGRPVALSSFRGRPVLLNFWASWCGPCRAELPELETLSRERPGCLAVLGVAEDSGDAATVAEFARQRRLTYPVLIDDGRAGAAYRVVTIPHSVLIDSEGRVVGTFSGAVTAWGVRDALRELAGAASRC
jgi:thiol-disulfide isomerase/thioredoxin